MKLLPVVFDRFDFIEGDPGMFSLFINEKTRRRKGRIGESAERHGDPVRVIVDRIPDRGSAARAKPLRDRAAFIAGSSECRRLALKELNVFLEKARLRRERAARPFLAFKTMTDGNSHRLALAAQADVAAGAGRVADDH